MAAIVAMVFVSVMQLMQMRRISDTIEHIAPEIEYCVWHHNKHTTKVIKGTKQAKKFYLMIGRPSDEGGCGNATK
jgi:hypothetical protein